MHFHYINDKFAHLITLFNFTSALLKRAFRPRRLRMIYELVVCAKSKLSENIIAKLQEMLTSILKKDGGEVLIFDDWGHLTLAQETKKGLNSIRILYFIYRASNDVNKELTRNIRVTEGFVRHLIVKLGDAEKADTIVKNLKTPFSKKYPGSVTDVDGETKYEDERERKNFSRRRTCYFTSKGIRADWKDPKSYIWLVNEFGKIAPARVSNVSRKHQRFVTTAIKRARNIGLISYMSNQIARPN